MLEALPGSFGATRDALHALGEHVLAPFRYRADGHIGLCATPGGFGTPVLGDGERVRVDGLELVHERPGATTRVRITTLGDAARFVGVEPGVPANLYTPATPNVPETPLALDAGGAHALATWLAFADTVLADVRDLYSTYDKTRATLWPEHFDLACEIGDRDAGTRADYGASPGDGAIPQPYLYVGPWEASRRTGRLGAHPWGAAVTYEALRAGGDPSGAAREFLLECAALLLGQP
jgi:hypothetical protein